jgi:hypothetical protein
VRNSAVRSLHNSATRFLLFDLCVMNDSVRLCRSIADASYATQEYVVHPRFQVPHFRTHQQFHCEAMNQAGSNGMTRNRKSSVRKERGIGGSAAGVNALKISRAHGTAPLM